MIAWLKSKLKFAEPQHITSGLVSVIIPFRNEEAKLPYLLQSLADQKYSGAWEVIFVNDHSTDCSAELVQRWIDQNAFGNYSLIHSLQNNEGKKQAISLGVKSAKGEIIVQTDADCTMNEHWLQSLLVGFDENTEMVLGPVAMLPQKGFWSKFAALEFLSLQATGAGFALGKKPIMGSAANMAYHKSAFGRLKFTGEKLSSGDDVFMIQTLAKENPDKVKFVMNKAAQTYTEAPATFAEFINQRARWGSKTTAYPSKLDVAVAGLIGVLSVLLCATAILSFWQFVFFEVFILALAMKGIEDYFFLKKYARLTGLTSLLKVFVPSMLMYPFYICITGMAMFFKTSWKGRFIQK